jgi:hypothetical protein
MAKANTTKKDEPSKALTTRPTNTAVALPNYGEQFAGKGWENTDRSDFQIPFLNQLQAMSPQCTDGDERQVEGAKPGMFFNSVTRELIDGDVFLLFALTKHCYVEWRPEDSGGGFVGEHDVMSDVVKKAKEAAKNPLELKTQDGNELVETYHVFALVLDSAEANEVKDQVVISFTKTKIKRYKSIMTRLRTLKGSDRIPLFAHRIKMSSTTETNPAGKKYKNVDLTPAIDGDVVASLLPGDSPILELADGLREAIMSGAAKANFDSAQTERASGGGKDEEADSVFGEESEGAKKGKKA